MNDTIRQSPSGRKLGAFAFARLSLSAVVAYADGVAKQIPFDTVDDQTKGFGELVSSGGILTAPGAFRLTQPGVYFMQAFAQVSNGGTSLQVAVVLGTLALGGDATNLGVSQTAVGNGVLVDLTAPGADASVILEVIGASGNILAGANLLILQVG